jgi:hypothetical protein
VNHEIAPRRLILASDLYSGYEMCREDYDSRLCSACVKKGVACTSTQRLF